MQDIPIGVNYNKIGHLTQQPKSLFKISWHNYNSTAFDQIKSKLNNLPNTKFDNGIDLSKKDDFINNIFLFQNQTSIPEITIETQEVKLPFYNFKVQSKFTFGDTFSITFTEVNTGSIRMFFREWQRLIQDYEGYSVQEQQQYKQDIKVEILFPNTTGFEPIYQYIFYGCYPTSVPSMEVNFSDVQTVEVQISFKYDYFEEYFKDIRLHELSQ